MEIDERKRDLVERLFSYGIIPVVSLSRAEQAVPLAESLVAGGLPCAEITFRTAAAASAIAQIRQRVPEILLGAGTVLTLEQLDTALDAGARFIVSPGTNPRVVEACLERNVPVFPGVCTPTEIEAALALGVDLLKFFPAEAMGGVQTLRALSGPYRKVRFLPTGGVDARNLSDYLALPQVVACGGSWMVKPEWLEAGQFSTIETQTREAVSLVRQARDSRG
ncbi:MAG: bifunctional 4-hydroxy-2-oxoglutarate aldolase/2-dehydro-3-deoxy-phosphogluconate aldolase [Blastocatellia bacterium]|jgi:2-dehydro-3-deoxyphosphogluconate aldolase/(4S)-4-hydroxy-2-oxoglutarate aldolase